MMQKCWDVDPSKRPTMRELFVFSYEKSKEISNNSSGSSNNNGCDIKKSFSLVKTLFNLFRNEEQVHETHPFAYHTSRILDDEIAKSKSLKSNDSSLNNLDINLNENFINI